MKGNQTGNADLICSSFSDEALQRLNLRVGTCREAEQAQLERARQRGTRMEQFSYAGGYSMPDGNSYQFYVATYSGPASSAEVEYVTYIFTLDRSGKIARVQ